MIADFTIKFYAITFTYSVVVSVGAACKPWKSWENLVSMDACEDLLPLSLDSPPQAINPKLKRAAVIPFLIFNIPVIN